MNEKQSSWSICRRNAWLLAENNQWRRYTTANDQQAGRSTALAQALAPPCLTLRIALLR